MIAIGNAVIEAVSLAHYRGKWLVLFFWPLDFTFVWPTAIRAYSNLSHDFNVSGAVLLGASEAFVAAA